MLPRPAAMAVPPSTASPASWNPAVPPPPVTGASVGNGVVTSGVGVGLAEGSGVGLIDSDGVSEGLGLSEAVGELSGLVVLVVVGVTVEVGVATGVNTAGGVELDVQAESATQASMVVKPQPTAVSLTRCAVHAMAVRALIEPPHALGNHHFPVADRRNRRPKGNRVAGLWSRTGLAGELRGRKHRRSQR
jgi:hypothetical protein